MIFLFISFSNTNEVLHTKIVKRNSRVKHIHSSLVAALLRFYLYYSAEVATETRALFVDDDCGNYLVSAMGHGVDIALDSIIERSIDGIADSGVVFSGRDEDVLDADGDTPAVGKPAVWL